MSTPISNQSDINPSANLLQRLANDHNIHLGDTLWIYTGNRHNWLYNKQHCIEINNAYNLYMEEDINPKLEITLSLNGTQIIYVIDFQEMIQYPKNDPGRFRNIGKFTFDTAEDIARYNIIGIAGTYL